MVCWNQSRRDSLSDARFVFLTEFLRRVRCTFLFILLYNIQFNDKDYGTQMTSTKKVSYWIAAGCCCVLIRIWESNFDANHSLVNSFLWTKRANVTPFGMRPLPLTFPPSTTWFWAFSAMTTTLVRRTTNAESARSSSKKRTSLPNPRNSKRWSTSTSWNPTDLSNSRSHSRNKQT